MKTRQTRSEIRKIASSILRDKGEGSRLPTNLESLLARERVYLQPFTSASDFDGRIECICGVPTIFVNTRGDAEHGRSRFTLAHEIGHYYLHRTALISGRRFDDARIDPSLDLPDTLEAEANAFASECLFPSEVMGRDYRDRVVSLRVLKELASRAQASLQASAIRLSADSADCFCFLLVVDGTVKWTAASDDWRYQRLPFAALRGNPLPARSLAAQQPMDFQEQRVEIGSWIPTQADRDLDLYESALDTSFGRLILLGVGDGEAD